MMQNETDISWLYESDGLFTLAGLISSYPKKVVKLIENCGRIDELLDIIHILKVTGHVNFKNGSNIMKVANKQYRMLKNIEEEHNILSEHIAQGHQDSPLGL